MTRPSPASVLALDQLSQIDPIGYARSRNHLDGGVTRLSAYLTHGIIALADVRDVALANARGFHLCMKFIQELAWRDYYHRLWGHLGNHIWSDLEPYKTGFDASDYAEELPQDLLAARTGIDYIDYFVDELHDTGYLHNHARMWLAAYVVHARRVKWQAGARWFLSHLLDGDEASNNLSWQWVASTFSHKPYVFNRENVLKYSGDRFAHHQASDPFDTDYESIAATLFCPPDPTAPQNRFDLTIHAKPESHDQEPFDPHRAITWVHDRMMSSDHPAVTETAGCFFVWDDARYARSAYSAGRIAFLQSALFCDDLHTGEVDLVSTIHQAARSRGATTIVTGATPDPRLQQAIAALAKLIQVRVVSTRPFVELTGRVDLRRFSRYWSKVEPLVRNLKPGQ